MKPSSVLRLKGYVASRPLLAANAMHSAQSQPESVYTVLLLISSRWEAETVSSQWRFYLLFQEKNPSWGTCFTLFMDTFLQIFNVLSSFLISTICMWMLDALPYLTYHVLYSLLFSLYFFISLKSSYFLVIFNPISSTFLDFHSAWSECSTSGSSVS